MSNSIKIRASQKKGETTVKALISHPMETGARKDSKTGKLIPAHFIQEAIFSFVNLKAKVVTPPEPEKADYIEYSLAGEPEGEAMAVQMSGGISKNPYVSVKLTGKQEKDLIQSKETRDSNNVVRIELIKEEGYGIMLSWKDNMGKSDSNFAPIK